MKWIEAHRNLDAGIPFRQEDWPAIEKSLNRFYVGVGVVGLAICLSIVAWGISTEGARQAAFVSKCQASGGKMVNRRLYDQCMN